MGFFLDLLSEKSKGDAVEDGVGERVTDRVNDPKGKMVAKSASCI